MILILTLILFYQKTHQQLVDRLVAQKFLLKYVVEQLDAIIGYLKKKKLSEINKDFVQFGESLNKFLINRGHSFWMTKIVLTSIHKLILAS